MKKTITVIISIIIIIAVTGIGSISVFAETTAKYWEPRPNSQDKETYVNGYGGIISVNEDWNKEDDTLTFWVDDSWHVTGWEFPTLTENEQYEIVSKKGNSITIRLLTKDRNLPYINVLVDNLEEGENENFDNKSNEETENKSTQNSNKINTTEANTISTTKTTVTAKENNLTEKNTASNNLIQQSESNSNKLIIPFVIVVLICIIIMGIVIKKNKTNKI